jgi:hypothetical protein
MRDEYEFKFVPYETKKKRNYDLKFYTFTIVEMSLLPLNSTNDI